jgi:hypothetical protein
VVEFLRLQAALDHAAADSQAPAGR